jgi:tetratricopeptide (TPR) repeat protein
MFKALLLLCITILAVSDSFCPAPVRHSQRCSSLVASSSNDGIPIKEHEEPLSLIFKRAVMLQRSGDQESALKEYDMFIKAAKQLDVSPEMYSEVHINIGAAQIKNRNMEEAKYHFEQALGYRQIGKAYVNLAVLALQKASMTRDPSEGIAALQEATIHCEKALALNDDHQSTVTANRLIDDIDKMLQQSRGQN